MGHHLDVPRRTHAGKRTSYIVQQVEWHFDVTMPDGTRLYPVEYFEELFEVDGRSSAARDADEWERYPDKWTNEFGEDAQGTITVIGRATYYPGMKAPPPGFTPGGHPGSGNLYSIPRPGGVWGEYGGERSNTVRRTMTFSYP